MHALIHMQPLNWRRQPIEQYPAKLVAILPRDAQPHLVCGSWELDKTKEMPYYARVWADGRHGGDYEVDLDPPSTKQRYLTSITFVQHLTVLPRRD